MEAMAREWSDDRLDGLSERVDLGFKHVDERFVRVDQRFDEVDRRFERIDQRFDEVDRRFVRVDQRFDQMEAGFEKVDADIRELRGEMAAMRRTMGQGLIALTSVMVSGFIGLFTLIVIAQL